MLTRGIRSVGLGNIATLPTLPTNPPINVKQLSALPATCLFLNFRPRYANSWTVDPTPEETEAFFYRFGEMYGAGSVVRVAGALNLVMGE
jgi:hypothetical protein